MHERIQVSLDLYPCDLLFVHRDAENAPLEQRIAEITKAVQEAGTRMRIPPTIAVVPVRMLESWLLLDAQAIRKAAANPHGTQPLNLLRPTQLENLPDPKKMLRQLLREASGLSGRRLNSFNHNVALHRIPDYIEDFSQLRTLPAFQRLEETVSETIRSSILPQLGLSP
jgi:hypothetical protein